MSGLGFPTTYGEAREKFLASLELGGYRHLRYRITHPDSAELFQDYALLRRDPRRLLIHISGVHGIEGYAGSAVQSALVSQPQGEDGPSILFVHALNPYGMAFYRRNNGENVDLNRNFRLGPARPNPDYRYFDAYLNPRSRLGFYTGLVTGFFHNKRLGKSRTAQAVASGQVSHPRGLFYMGTSVQREIHLFQELLKHHGSEAEEVTVIDLHTGLGGFGEEMLFCDEDLDPSAPEYFREAFGRPVTLPDPSEGIYENQGRLSDAIRHILPGAKLHYVLQEFGALPPLQTLNAVREENFAWHQNRGGFPSDRIVRQMVNAFLPDDDAWRKSLLVLGKERWYQALDYLNR